MLWRWRWVWVWRWRVCRGWRLRILRVRRVRVRRRRRRGRLSGRVRHLVVRLPGRSGRAGAPRPGTVRASWCRVRGATLRRGWVRSAARARTAVRRRPRLCRPRVRPRCRGRLFRLWWVRVRRSRRCCRGWVPGVVRRLRWWGRWCGRRRRWVVVMVVRGWPGWSRLRRRRRVWRLGIRWAGLSGFSLVMGRRLIRMVGCCSVMAIRGPRSRAPAPRCATAAMVG